MFKLSRVYINLKKLLEKSAFTEKFVIMSPFTSRDGVAAIFILFRKRFSIDQ